MDSIELYDVPKNELAHYSKKTIDIMYKFPHGLEELEGIANRTDFDLGSHSKKQKELNIKSNVAANKDSNSKLAVQDEEGNWVVPFVNSLLTKICFQRLRFYLKLTNES